MQWQACAKTVLEEIPEVKNTARFRTQGPKIVMHNNISFNEKNIGFADNSVVDMFAIKLSMGNPDAALVEPNTIIISTKAANKYFGDDSAIGKVLTIDNDHVYKVTGVFQEIPKNTHFNFDFLMSLESIEESKQQTWL